MFKVNEKRDIHHLKVGVIRKLALRGACSQKSKRQEKLK